MDLPPDRTTARDVDRVWVTHARHLSLRGRPRATSGRDLLGHVTQACRKDTFNRDVHVSRRMVCVHPSCPPLADTESPFCAGGVARVSTAMRAVYTALPQGPSLRSGLCCPSPSLLNRPHPPHSRAHRDFAARRFIRDVFAVLLPRRPTSGSVLLLLVPSRHAVLCDPGELAGDLRPTASPMTLAFASSGHARRSQVAPTIRFKWVPRFRGFSGSPVLRPVELLASLTDPTGSPQPQRRVHPGFRRVGHPSRRRI